VPLSDGVPPASPDRGGGGGRRAGRGRRPPLDLAQHVRKVRAPHGDVPMLRVMQTNACVKDCYYCPFRSGRNLRRESIAPGDLARAVDSLHRAGLVRGIFLSSGVVGTAESTMSTMIETAEILKSRYRFAGHLHLKLMPGASDAALAAAMSLADRVSLNLEAPNAERLATLTGTKVHGSDLLSPLTRVLRLAAEAPESTWKGRRRLSATTQLVVGAAGESDSEILSASQALYRDLRLARVYYSAFRPIPDTPLDGLPAENPMRQHRLYQADRLIRDYGFRTEDLHLPGGRLPLDVDPKLAWARAHPWVFPLEVNRASPRELMRVPGIGPVLARRIQRARSRAVIRSASELRLLGAPPASLPWLELDGRRQARQLELPMPATTPSIDMI